MDSSVTQEARLEKLLQRLASLKLMRPPSSCELTPPQIGILFLVRRSPGCGVLELADELGVTGPTISVAVSRLVKSDWLEQRSDPTDRRAKPLFLTKRSEALLSEIRVYQREMLNLFMSGLGAQEQEDFLRLFDKALSSVEEKIDLD